MYERYKRGTPLWQTAANRRKSAGVAKLQRPFNAKGQERFLFGNQRWARATARREACGARRRWSVSNTRAVVSCQWDLEPIPGDISGGIASIRCEAGRFDAMDGAGFVLLGEVAADAD